MTIGSHCINAWSSTQATIALSSAEATVMRTFLLLLRADLPLFSHGLVHDAVYLHNDVSDAVITQGFPALRLSRKSWSKARAKAEMILSQAGYRSDAKIESCDLPSRSQNLRRYMVPTVDNLWMSSVRIPQSMQ